MAGIDEIPFNRFLKENRSELNSAFAAARRRQVGLDPNHFSSVLSTLVGPAFDALTVDDDSPLTPNGRAGRIGTSLYRAALDLEVQGRISPLMEKAWRDLIPRFGKLLVTGVEPLIGAASNAVVSLERSTAGRAEQWVSIMERVSPAARNADTWLRAGQVASWRSGMAAYRRQALDLAESFDDILLAAIFGLGDDDPFVSGGETVERLRIDPWFDPASQRPGASEREPMLVGGFAGFGGPFQRPPVVLMDGADVVATDGIGLWHVLADAFGSAVVRLESLAEPGPVVGVGSGVNLDVIPEPSSMTTSSLGIVVTSRLSHSIFLLGPAQQ